MKLKTETKPLKAALTSMATVVPKRSTIPCLTHVKLFLKGNTLSITGTDLDLWASVELSAAGSEGEPALVELKALRNALKPIKAQTVELTSSTTHLSVGTTKLPLMPFEDYPLKPQHEGEVHESHLSSGGLSLKRAIIACTNDDSRYYLSAIQVTPTKLHATDGHRLMIVETPPSGGDDTFLVPQLMVNLAIRLSKDEDITWGLSDNWVGATIGWWRLIHRRDDASFPNVDKVIPKNYKNSLTCERIPLLEALEGLLPFTNERSNAVSFGVGEKTIHLESTRTEDAISEANVLAEVTGKPIAIGFNARYLIDALKVSAAERIEFTWKDDSHPAVLKAEDWRYVLMPVRL